MMARMVACLILALLGVGLANAETLKTPSGNKVEYQLPDGWAAVQSAPEPLITEQAEHLRHDAELQGKNPTKKQLEQLVVKRLAANELLLYHEVSGAWVGFDFSPLRKDEQPPDAKTLELSARYALESLENEEGVSQFSGRQEILDIRDAPGTRYLAANYRQHEQPRVFQGLIGYTPAEWFFIYATSYPDAADVRSQIKSLFKSLIIHPSGE